MLRALNSEGLLLTARFHLVASPDALALLRGRRAGILEKLAHATVASFDDADLHQVFQAYLLLDQQSALLLHADLVLCTPPVVVIQPPAPPSLRCQPA